MYDKTADVCLPLLKYVPDWFITCKILENLAVFFKGDIVFVNADSDIVKYLVVICIISPISGVICISNAGHVKKR